MLHRFARAKAGQQSAVRQLLDQRVAESPRRPFHLRASLSLRQLSDTRVALPLDVCHFAWHNIHFEGAEMANAAFLSLNGNFVVSGRQGNPKMSLVVGGERRHLALLAFHYESSIRERL
jgi:hypothetical protein